MDDYLKFTGPVKLIIIERALLKGRGDRSREFDRKILTRLVLDKSGNPASELREESSVTYSYDAEGNPVLIREKNKSGHIVEEIRMTYNKGLLVKKDRTDPGGNVRESRTYRYDSRNRLSGETCGSRNIRYEYSDDILSREYRYYGKEPELAFLYSGKGDGGIETIKVMNSRGKLVRTEKYLWNDGLLAEQKIIRGDDTVLKDERFEYDCFHDGNWLKRIRYNRLASDGEIPVEIIYRSIAFSDSCPEVEPLHDNSPDVLKEDKKSLSFSDGSTYRGEILNGKMEGKGYIQWPDGSSYKGEFHGNRMDGQGILTWANGDIYSGTFSMGKMEGIGRLRWTGGKVFYGLFEDNRRTRQGIIEEDE